MRKQQLSETEQMTEELKKVHLELERLNTHRLMKGYNSLPLFLLYNFTKGTMIGLGTVVGATLVSSIAIYVASRILNQVELVPILGEWIQEVMKEVNITPAP